MADLIFGEDVQIRIARVANQGIVLKALGPKHIGLNALYREVVGVGMVDSEGGENLSHRFQAHQARVIHRPVGHGRNSSQIIDRPGIDIPHAIGSQEAIEKDVCLQDRVAIIAIARGIRCSNKGLAVGGVRLRLEGRQTVRQDQTVLQEPSIDVTVIVRSDGRFKGGIPGQPTRRKGLLILWAKGMETHREQAVSTNPAAITVGAALLATKSLIGRHRNAEIRHGFQLRPAIQGPRTGSHHAVRLVGILNQPILGRCHRANVHRKARQHLPSGGHALCRIEA